MFLAHGVLEGVPHTGFSLVSVFYFFLCSCLDALLEERSKGGREERGKRTHLRLFFDFIFEFMFSPAIITIIINNNRVFTAVERHTIKYKDIYV